MTNRFHWSIPLIDSTDRFHWTSAIFNVSGPLSHSRWAFWVHSSSRAWWLVPARHVGVHWLYRKACNSETYLTASALSLAIQVGFTNKSGHKGKWWQHDDKAVDSVGVSSNLNYPQKICQLSPATTITASSPPARSDKQGLANGRADGHGVAYDLVIKHDECELFRLNNGWSYVKITYSYKIKSGTRWHKNVAPWRVTVTRKVGEKTCGNDFDPQLHLQISYPYEVGSPSYILTVCYSTLQ